LEKNIFIIIVTYNTEKWLKKYLDSCFYYNIIGGDFYNSRKEAHVIQGVLVDYFCAYIKNVE